MKKITNYILLITVISCFASCAKDNYDAPNATLKGRIVYNGQPINVEYNQVRFQLWESGYANVKPIDVSIAQDGGYSAVLFNNTYKLTFPGGQGPFMTKQSGAAKDTIVVNLSGNQELDIEVLPYYMVRDAQFTAGGGNITSTFKLEKIINDANAKDIDRVTLYINKTQFVSEGNNIAKTSINGADITNPNSVNMSVAIPSLVPAQNYVYARIGVRIANVEDWIFSDVKKITF
jgi:hypothetical protein